LTRNRGSDSPSPLVSCLRAAPIGSGFLLFSVICCAAATIHVTRRTFALLPSPPSTSDLAAAACGAARCSRRGRERRAVDLHSALSRSLRWTADRQTDRLSVRAHRLLNKDATQQRRQSNKQLVSNRPDRPSERTGCSSRRRQHRRSSGSRSNSFAPGDPSLPRPTTATRLPP